MNYCSRRVLVSSQRAGFGCGPRHSKVGAAGSDDAPTHRIRIVPSRGGVGGV